VKTIDLLDDDPVEFGSIINRIFGENLMLVTGFEGSFEARLVASCKVYVLARKLSLSKIIDEATNDCKCNVEMTTNKTGHTFIRPQRG
jgi:hypothetical protein